MNDPETTLLIQAVKAWNTPIGEALATKIDNLENQLYYRRRDEERTKETNPA